jgi:hypothetical protein
METSRKPVGNSSLVSIRKAPAQNVLSNANEHEKAQIPTLSLEALRAIARIIQAIKTRIATIADAPHGQHDTRTGVTPYAGSPAPNCPDGSEDHDERAIESYEE